MVVAVHIKNNLAYKGQCNGCGVCCVVKTVLPEHGFTMEFRCTNLLVSDRIGREGATFCAVWETKYDGMPTVMRSAQGVSYQSTCLASYPRAHDAVPPECSYKFVPDAIVQIQPQWSLGYLPSMKES